MEKEQTEFFECDCHNRDDMIIARKSLWSSINKDGSVYKDIDIVLEMITSKEDWNCYNHYDFFLWKWLKQVWWRFKESIKLFIIGKVVMTGYWMPARTDYESGKLIGIEETKRLGEALIKFANDAKEFYEDNKVTT